jgi:hypothetical protein
MMTRNDESTRGSAGRWTLWSATLLPVVLLLAGVLVVGVLGQLVGSPFVVSLSIGFLLGLVNLWLMARLLGFLVFGGSSRLASLCGLGLSLKLAGLVGAVYALVVSDVAEPLPLVIGCAASPLVHVFKRSTIDPSSRGGTRSALSPLS